MQDRTQGPKRQRYTYIGILKLLNKDQKTPWMGVCRHPKSLAVYGFVDQGILSSKLVQAWTAPKLCYRQHDVEAELNICLSMSDKKSPRV